MEVITYSLKNNNYNSDIYYKEIGIYTDEVLNRIKNELSILIKEYQSYIKENNVEEMRTFEEYALELLTLGVLWQCYIYNARQLKLMPKNILIFLSSIRKKSIRLKPQINFIKGRIITKYILPLSLNKNYDLELNIENFNILLSWLRAVGDYEQEIKRLTNWRNYLKNKDDVYINKTLSFAISLAEWFKNRSKQVLNKYTKNVQFFLEDTYVNYNYREDVIFCGRKEVEYHLNMVGAEIMNRAFREDFLKTSKKMLLLPGCMRQKGNSCKAVKTDYGYACSNCDSKCKINQFTNLGKMNNFEVLTIPHESDAFSNDKVKFNNIGIVGVACVLNLISGGWKAKEFNFVPQCVILDYCGCKNHWHCKGIVTDINRTQLNKILCI